MFNDHHRVGIAQPTGRSGVKLRTIDLMSGTDCVPFGETGPLHKRYKALLGRVSAPPVSSSSVSVEGEKPDRQTEQEDCDYSLLSHRLVVFFRWRGADAAEDLAQETLQRGFSKMAAGIELYSSPKHYFFAIAKNVLRESRRTQLRAHYCVGVDLETFSGYATVDDHDGPAARLKDCLSTLSNDDRHVVVQYYEGEREKLLGELGVDANALRVRVHRAIRRIRERLAALDSPATSQPEACAAGPVKVTGSFQSALAASAHSTRCTVEDSTTMSKSTRNTGKQWTSSEKSQLRQMAKENTPTRVIGLKLGRTPEAVYSQASKQGTSLGPTNQSPYNRRTT
jgi:DNA-directed RNA polymerase specialized sigma24 family protein